MSFENARYLIEKNKDTYKKDPINQVTPITETENPLLQQYKRQVQRYQEIIKELEIWQKIIKNKNRNQKEDKEGLEKETKTPLSKSQAIKLPTTKQDIIEFLNNAPLLHEAKKQIITNLYQEACTYNEIAKYSTNEEDKEECKKEIEAILYQIEWIQNYQKKEEKEVSKTTHNNMIFLTSNSGRIIPLEEISKNIPIEFYDSLKEALISIENGTFIGFKPLTKRKYNQLRKPKVRVLFSQINKNTFLVLSCFFKNYDTNLKYKENLDNLSYILMQKESEYKTLAQDPNYLEEQEKIKNTIYNILTTKRDETNEQTLERKRN